MDKFEKAIETLLSMTPVGLAATGPKKLKNLIDKAKKEKGKPKGKSPSMVLGSASKAGMQSKQGKRRPPRPPLTPRLGPKFGPRVKTNGREGSMVENYRKNKKSGRRG